MIENADVAVVVDADAIWQLAAAEDGSSAPSIPSACSAFRRWNRRPTARQFYQFSSVSF